jgi:hypothetical protein
VLPSVSLVAPRGLADNGIIPNALADETYTAIGKKRNYTLIGRKRSYTIRR